MCGVKQRIAKQFGFTLLDLLVAALLFSVTVLGVLRYQQALHQQFTELRHQQRAWQLAHDALEGYRAADPGLPPLPEELAGWQRHIQLATVSAECERVSAQVVSPRGQQVSLARWICRAEGVDLK